MYKRSTVSLPEFLHNDIFVRFQKYPFFFFLSVQVTMTPQFPMITVLKFFFTEVLLVALQYYVMFRLK
jgi:hypothetical protein